MSRAVQVLVAAQHEDGSWASHEHQGYASAIATLALSEAYGMTGSEELRGPAQRAVDFWVRTQSVSGGWRYSPGDGDAPAAMRRA